MSEELRKDRIALAALQQRLAAMDEMLRLKLSPDARARLEKLGAADAVPDKSA
jgi:hypothetical protein